MTIKEDKRKFSICIASGDMRYYKHLDSKNKRVCNGLCNEENEKCASSCVLETGLNKALIEAQRLANKTGKKVCVMSSVYNVFPDKEVKG